MEPIFGDSYKLKWNVKGDSKTVCVVHNYSIDKEYCRTIKIINDDKKMKEINMRFIVYSWNEIGPFIMVSDDFLSFPKKFQEGAIWHEVGHIYHEHYLKDTSQNQEEMQEMRLTAILANDVAVFEKEADDFAVSKIGSETIIQFLKICHATRPVDSTINDLGKLELELRIKRLGGKL